jgi:hypothetical protein
MRRGYVLSVGIVTFASSAVPRCISRILAPVIGYSFANRILQNILDFGAQTTAEGNETWQ